MFAELKKYGLLLQTDANLPSVCALVAGEPVRGSWWGHPRSQEMFNAISDLEDHADVLVTKLVSHKVTYLHRSLWPALIGVGRAREPWQVGPLSREARQLLREVDRKPVLTDRRVSKAGSELERNLLVSVEQFHTESGSHARRLESWDRWSGRTGYSGEVTATDVAKLRLEVIVASLNRQFNARGFLPWQKKISPNGPKISQQ